MSGEQVVSYDDGKVRTLRVTYDGRIVTLPPEHDEVHKGYSYTVADYAELANGVTGIYLFKVPDMFPLQAHFVLNVENTLEAAYTFYEGSTVSADGTQFTPMNRNRNSSRDALVTVFHTPTVTDLGTALLRSKQGVNRQYGGRVRSENEIVLKNNTNYILTVQNLAAGTNTINGLASWYEHEFIE